MQPFTYFEHTADVGLAATGRDLPEAFANAARGLVNLLVDPAGVRETTHRQVALVEEGPEELLVAWLNELLFLFDSEGFVPVSFTFAALSETALEATLGGERFDPARHRARSGVKAATYHEVTVECDDVCRLRVILDV